jgi:hypothetical protein
LSSPFTVSQTLAKARQLRSNLTPLLHDALTSKRNADCHLVDMPPVHIKELQNTDILDSGFYTLLCRMEEIMSTISSGASARVS